MSEEMWIARCDRKHVEVVLPEMDSYGLCTAVMWEGARRSLRQCGLPLIVEDGWTVSPPENAIDRAIVKAWNDNAGPAAPTPAALAPTPEENNE